MPNYVYFVVADRGGDAAGRGVSAGHFVVADRGVGGCSFAG